LSFRLPLTQEQLGDLLGLTPVHVSRTLSALRDDNLLHRRRYQVTIFNLVDLREAAGYQDFHTNHHMKPLFQHMLEQ
jgi:predicted transcriptional regulator